MTKTQAIQQEIDEIMDTFDFAKVQRAMELLDWRWGSPPDDAVPEEYELRRAARERLNSLHQNQVSSTGGFFASKDEGIEDGKPWVRINLQFVLEDSGRDGVEYGES
jgi:hypothetical protein